MLWIFRIFLVVVMLVFAFNATATAASPSPSPLPRHTTGGHARGEGRKTINDVYVIHLVVDGTNYETMWRAIREGKLPTIKEVLVDNGAVFTSAISTFPSTSTSAYQSFITGLLPGHAGIPHLQRFDRQHEEFIDYLSPKGYLKLSDDFINLDALQNPATANLDATNTIFELLDGYPTLSLYTTSRRGASESVPENIPVRGLWAAGVSHDYLHIDQLAYDKLLKKYGGKLEDVPRYTLVGLYSSDVSGHHYGADNAEVVTVLTQFDYFLRDFVELLEKQGIRDKTYIIVSADHGMHDTGSVFLFRKALIDKGLAVKPRNPKIKDYNIVPADRGISSTHVYTRRPDGTFAPLEDARELTRFPLKDGAPVDLIDLIEGLGPTELVAVRDGDDATLVYNHDGNASRIACTLLNAERWCSYEVFKPTMSFRPSERSEGAEEPLAVPYDSTIVRSYDRTRKQKTRNDKRIDPLEISGKKAKQLIDGKPHSSQEWKHATADEYYTDAVVQLGTIFQDGRAGDLFVIPQNAWGFRVLKAATHGSLIRDDMHIPMFIAGPSVPRGTYGVMRTVDIYPLLLEWFGFDIPVANYDGVNPLEKFRGEDKLWQRLATIDQAISNCHSDRPSETRKRRNPLQFSQCASVVRRRAGYQRAALKKLAAMELEDRELLSVRLKRYISALEAQKDDKHAPRVALPEYVDDHLAIARMIENETEKRKARMEMIVDSL
jgi:arylsulfatase A-like enzyme